MGSESSRVETRWWEVKAQQKLRTTTSIGKVEVLCSLVPGVHQATMIRYLKERPDLDTLFALHCGRQSPSTKQHADPSSLTVEMKASELWHAIRTPLGYSRSPWDWNWQPPLTGAPSEIATEFHVAVCRAIFRVPFFDFVKCALGYSTEERFVGSLLNAVCDVRDGLRRAFRDRPGTQDLYNKVEEVLKQRHHPLAYWIVASSLFHTTYAPFDTLAAGPIQTIFATRNLDLVLKRLAAINRRFVHVNQRYDWQMWSTDLDFWEYVDQALWSGKLNAPFILPQLSMEDREKRLRFLEGFETVTEDKAHNAWSKVRSAIKRLAAGLR
ncbi:Uncharacterized protein BP5553_10476 [Venustampulla echinocandica]|uniref:Uncharacterized protein n=1 Tax=Venustampulla echinocandica TaxID=2656787 RepID=A0A370T9F7_9HELO|nr:Uncharacterized protein BP5553_10476 [Venustampulla echinocandica]RDL30198.1 Uncharacterized protein BP5553_10476 [Venustampulla echinocandica]